MKSASFPVVEVGGSPRDIGYQHGVKLRDLIHSSIECNLKNVAVVSKEKCFNLADKFLPYAEEYAPELIEEIRGIAEGAEVNFKEIFLLNCYMELRHVFVRPQYALAPGCTTFAAAGKATASDDVFLGWNCDFFDYWEKTVVALRVKPETESPMLTFTYAGMVGANAGLNSNFGFVVNGLNTRYTGPGVPYTFICRKILQQERIGDAMDAIITAKRTAGSSKHILLGDTNGELYSVETTPTDFEVTCPIDGYIGHSNHYVNERLKPFEMRVRGISDSIVRWSRINKLLKENYGEITIEDCKGFMKDHVNYPLSICRHVWPEEGSMGKTITSFICELDSSRVWLTKGNPCQNEYAEYSL